MEDVDSPVRLKFYGVRDLANGWLAEKAVALVQSYSSGRKLLSLNDALELHNALEFEKNNIFPNFLTAQDHTELALSARESRRRVASFFSTIEASNLKEHLNKMDFQYADDLLRLIERHGVAKRVGGQMLFEALSDAALPLEVMLADRQFVNRNDRKLREVMLSDAQNGELLVRMRLVKDSNPLYHLPASLSGEDMQQLLSAYIGSASPHLNYVQAIAESNDNDSFGLTPKIRLEAKKRHKDLIEELLAEKRTKTTNTYHGLRLDPEQRKPVIDRVERDENSVSYVRSFSEKYLLSSMDPERILLNFASVVGFLERGLLTMPSFKGQLGALRTLLISGRDAYPRGSAFNYVDALTLNGTQFYSDFLRQYSIEVEDSVAWFFREYLVDKFGAANFYFAASSPSSSFLERCRHISAEMESIARQFSLYCDEGVLDPELLQMTSTPRPWAAIPSFTERKYLHRGSNHNCDRAMHLLFSDQSGMTYISSELKASNFVELITENEVSYESVRPHQKESIDWLIDEGLVAVDSDLLEFAQPVQVLVLSDINNREAAAYGHYGTDEASAALVLMQKGWLEFSSTLLTRPEASYFNYFLNKSEFSDGPDLRNKYAHGTNSDPGDISTHRQSYFQLLRLLVALTLKIKDEFRLAARAQPSTMSETP